MEITIIRENSGEETSKFNIIKSKDMTWLMVLVVLEIAKKEVLDNMR